MGSDRLSMAEYSEYDGRGLAEVIASGQTSEAEVVDVARAAIESVNSDLNALAHPLFETPLEHRGSGPFLGVPFLIKDVGPYAAGVPFSVGSMFFEGAVAAQDHELMRRFRDAGLVAIGTSAVPEMAISFATESRRLGPTRNPWDLRRGVGGSSGGAAALVAAGAVPVAHANDGAGSIRVPAAFCGLVGLKPTRGRTPTDVETMFGIGYEFALTRTVRDAAYLLDCVEGPQPTAKYQIARPAVSYAEAVDKAMPTLRVGLMTQAWSGVEVDPECAAAAVAVAQELERMGHQVEEVAPSVDPAKLLRAYRSLTTVALAATLASYPREPSDDLLEAVSMSLWREAHELNAVEIGLGIAAFDDVCRAAGTFFEEYDLLVTPTTARTAIPHGTLTYDSPDHSVETWLASIFEVAPFTAAFNIAGQPAVSLPIAHSGDELPIGVQLVAGYGREDRLLQAAAVLEQTMPWRNRRPTVHVASR
ncbi:amidase [Nocardioides sp. LS1]|uniref:amidase n=1 Tax=Nocardioides sp. LS1 TaxID=1027620 RepID=UPI000F62777D|nr:amidase family protein [Nocardioides sp. LS1]GCD88626.1 amidase [Nocardioides sp. LS1]